MKNTKLVISLCVAIVFVVVGMKYINNKKAELVKVEDTSKVVLEENTKPFLSPQEGLPPVVEAKRQAIY